MGEGLVVGCSGLNEVLVLRNIDTREGLNNTHYNPLHPLQGRAGRALRPAAIGLVWAAQAPEAGLDFRKRTSDEYPSDAEPR